MPWLGRDALGLTELKCHAGWTSQAGAAGATVTSHAPDFAPALLMQPDFTPVVVAGLLGFGGSLHCVAMCGPLAMALPLGNGSQGGAWRLLRLGTYNLGRLSSYAVAGGLAALLGGALHWGGGDRLRLALTLLAALLVISTVAAQAGWIRPWAALERPGRQLWRSIMPLAQRIRLRQDLWGVLAMGMIWGWLPCGMVYAALGLAASTGHAGMGALVMVAFGAGTLPSLMTLSWLGARLPQLGGQRRLRQGLAAGIIAVTLWSSGSALLPEAYTGHHHPTGDAGHTGHQHTH